MRVRLEDMKAKKQTLVIAGVEYLVAYTVEAQLLADVHFAEKGQPGGGLKVLHARLRNTDLHAFMQLAWVMIEDKKELDTYEKFLSAVKSSGCPMEVFQMLVVKVLADSNPAFEGGEDESKKKLIWKTAAILGWTTALLMIAWRLVTAG